MKWNGWSVDFERTGVLPEVQGVSELIEGSLLVTEPVFTDTLLQIYPGY